MTFIMKILNESNESSFQKFNTALGKVIYGNTVPASHSYGAESHV
jgi:hypothetical protein